MCDRQDLFSAGHNDWQVFKFQQYILYKRPTRIASDRNEVPTAGHDVRHWQNIYFKRLVGLYARHMKEFIDKEKNSKKSNR